MEASGLLLRAYYELLYERLAGEQERAAGRIEQLLREETGSGRFGEVSEDRREAYIEVGLAFLVERLEMYNPVGVQSTFDGRASKQAQELEFELDWYDARGEYETLVATARQKAEPDMSGGRLRELAAEMIGELGAYPDRSIISAYEAEPAVHKLCDYAVAKAVEEVVRH